MKQCGLIGDPVEHSLSPAMHNVAFRETGIAASYALWRTGVSDVSDRIASLRSDDVLGANVTVPHKRVVVRELDEISSTARRIGAVNTITNRAGTLCGDNTDVYGFVVSLRDAGLEAGRGDTALVLGAGGAARAVIVGLQQLDFERILLANRTHDKARILADELGEGAVTPTSWDTLHNDLPGADIIVNATSLGWHVGESPLTSDQVSAISLDALVVDLTYRETDLLRASRSRGVAVVDGLDMLVHQGARSFTLWTGVEAPIGAMRRAVETEQERRAEKAL